MKIKKYKVIFLIVQKYCIYIMCLYNNSNNRMKVKRRENIWMTITTIFVVASDVVSDVVVVVRTIY